MLSDGIAYVTSDRAVTTPFAQGFRVLDTMPLDVKQLAARLAAEDVGTVEIKKRGVDVDPAQFRKRLRLRGRRSVTLVLTRLEGRHTAVLCERLAGVAG